MRDKFRTVLSSIPKPKSGDPAMIPINYKGSWKYFQSLLFLRDQFTARTSGGNFISLVDEAEVNYDYSELTQEDCQDVDEIESQSMPGTDESVPHSPAETAESRELTTPSTSAPSSSRGGHQNINIRKRRNVTDNIGSALLDVERKKLQYIEDKRLQSADDDDMNFFRSLLPHIKKLTPYEKMSYRMEILKVTKDFMKPGNQSNATSNPPSISGDNNSAVTHSHTAKTYYNNYCSEIQTPVSEEQCHSFTSFTNLI